MKNKNIVLILAIIFFAYNFFVFFICGFNGHGIVFWTSYILELLSFVALVWAFTIVSKEKSPTELLFFGYSMMFWGAIFEVSQTLVSVLFLIIDNYFKIAIIIQLLLFIGFIVIVLLCKQTEETIVEVQSTRKAQISNMQLMISQMEIIASIDMPDELKNKVKKLSDKFKYSDIVSSDETEEMENQLSSEIALLKGLCKAKSEDADILIKHISEHLEERNALCKASKKRY